MMKNLYFILFLLILTACLDEPDCLREASNEVKIAFKNIEDGKSLNVEFIQVLISGTDSIFYAGSTRTSITVPVDPYDTEATLILESNIATDTITFSYNNLTRLISPDCGPETYIQNITIEKNTTDSLRIVDINILPGVTVNYEVYY